MHQIHKYNSLPKRELVEERPEPVEDTKKVAKMTVSRQVRLHLFLRREMDLEIWNPFLPGNKW